MAGEEKEEYEAEQRNKVEKEQEDAEGRLERRTREGGRQKKDGGGGEEETQRSRVRKATFVVSTGNTHMRYANTRAEPRLQ